MPPTDAQRTAQPGGSGNRTCMWFSWFGYGNDHARGAREARGVPDEHHVRPGGDEPIEQVLRKVVVDLARRDRRAEVPVATRVVDVDVEPVLVGGVLVERTAAAAADVTDHDPRRLRVRRSVGGDHREERPDRPLVPVQPPRLVRRPVRDGIPRDPVRPGKGQLRPVHEAPCEPDACRGRSLPGDRPELRRQQLGAGALDADGRGRLAGQVEAELARVEREARRVLEERASRACGAVAQRGDGQHRGRAEDERDGGDRPRRELPASRRARGETAPPRRLEPGLDRREEAAIEQVARERRRRERGRAERRAPLLPEPEQIGVEPDLVHAPCHGVTSFARKVGCPPTMGSALAALRSLRPDLAVRARPRPA